MFDSLRMSIGAGLARMKFRKAQDPVISFSGVVTQARTVLVILPLDRRELLSAFQTIELLRKTFHEEDITVVGDERGQEIKRLMPKCRFLPLQQNDVTMFFLPHRQFLSHLKSRPYDVAIDLNLDFLLPSSYICRESGARVRVGFTGPQADFFYNLQIKPDPSKALNSIYDRVARCLEMF